MRKILLAVGASLLLLSGCGVAYAVDQAPVPGTPLCDTAVAADSNVKAAKDEQAKLPAGASATEKTSAAAVVASAESAATTALCTGKTTTTTTTPPATAGPSVAAICAATSIAQVDDLLAQVTGALPAQLMPLADVVVIQDAKSPTVVDAVQLSDVKQQLSCATGTSTATATPPTTTVAPTTTPKPSGTFADCAAARAAGKAPLLIGDPGYDASLDSDNDGIACEDADADSTGSGSNSGSTGSGGTSLPTGGVDTGDGSTIIG